jgi:hypothetical protein
MVTMAFAVMMPTTAAPGNSRGLSNQGFENGNYAGWSLYRPYGWYGSAYVRDRWYIGQSGVYYLYAPEGDYFAIIRGDHYRYATTLRQAFYIDAGSEISGFAAYDWNDYPSYYDPAWVRVYTSWGMLVSTPWYQSGVGLPSYGFVDWTAWSWRAPSSGTYILEFAAMNRWDTAMDPYAFFDMPEGIPALVDFEPKSLNLESNGNYVQGKIYGFPENPEYTHYDVNVGTVQIAGVGIDMKFETINANKLIIKSDRLLVEDAIGAPGDEVEVKIRGNLNDGTAFNGMALIKAILNQ